MVNGFVSLCQRMLIGEAWMMVWRSAARVLSFLSDSGWILPLRSGEAAELLRYLNAVLLVAALPFFIRFAEWRKARRWAGPPQIARNHFARLCISPNDRRPLVTAAGSSFFDRVRVGHSMVRDLHVGTLSAACTRFRVMAKRLLPCFDRLAGDRAA